MGATGSRRPAVRPTLCCSSDLVSTSSCSHGQGNSGPECSSLISLDSQSSNDERVTLSWRMREGERSLWRQLVTHGVGWLNSDWTTQHPFTVPKGIVPTLSTEMAYCLQRWHIVHRDGILQPLVLPALQAMGQDDNARPPSSTCR